MIVEKLIERAAHSGKIISSEENMMSDTERQRNMKQLVKTVEDRDVLLRKRGTLPGCTGFVESLQQILAMSFMPLLWAVLPESLAFAGASAGDEEAEERSGTKGDTDGFVRAFTHGFVSGFSTGDGFIADIDRDFFGAFQRGMKTFAGFRHFFPGHVCRAGNDSGTLAEDARALMAATAD